MPDAAGAAAAQLRAGARRRRRARSTAARLALARDLQLAFRKRGQLVQPLAFFAIVTMLFPLAISPELSRLREMAPGVLWVAALLASLLALEFLFRDDAHDGTLEQYALVGPVAHLADVRQDRGALAADRRAAGAHGAAGGAVARRAGGRAAGHRAGGGARQRRR